MLTAPFFTNPPLHRLVHRVEPDRDAIERHLGLINGGLDDVRAVIAGHAHYDHIMDLPVVARHLPINVVVLGGPTVCNSLGASFERACADILANAGTYRCAATPFVVNRRIHVRPYFSEHAPQVGRAKLATGHYRTLLSRPPARPGQWLEGETLAFLIDFLDDAGDIDLRVYYNDSAPGTPYGLPDLGTLMRRVDVAIFAVASFAKQAGYPQDYVEAMNPRHVLLGHWESFLRPVDEEMEAVRGTNVAKFIELLGGVPHTWPRKRHQVVTVSY